MNVTVNATTPDSVSAPETRRRPTRQELGKRDYLPVLPWALLLSATLSPLAWLALIYYVAGKRQNDPETAADYYEFARSCIARNLWIYGFFIVVAGLIYSWSIGSQL